MIKRRKILVGNWKMNPNSLEDAVTLTTEIKQKLENNKKIDVVVCPPYIFLNEVGAVLKDQKKIKLGSQDVFGGDGTSFTGEVSVDMIKNAGAEYAIVGHSERRKIFETLEMVSEKVVFSLKGGLKTILCVGEIARDEQGEFYNFIKTELLGALLKIKKSYLSNLIIAYEPIWAIGKKESEAISPENLHEMTIFIKKILNDKFKEEGLLVPILYGGSVNKNNVKEIISRGQVDGILLGRESLKFDNFTEIANILGEV
ncbi:MAG: triose-phosphate isomerase [Minisyncoccia bacterium]